MEEIKIKKQLYELALNGTGRFLDQAIAIAAIETTDPIKYLKNQYNNPKTRDKLPMEFFEENVLDITDLMLNSNLQEVWPITTGNYRRELSYLAYQLCLEQLMIRFGIMTTDRAVYAYHEILTIHANQTETEIVRYGISDIEVPSNQTPSKYVQVFNDDGMLLTEAEVYFIENETKK